MTHGARQAPLNSRSSSSAAARDLPVQPTRLSLTPSHARDHSARMQQGQALRMDAAGFEAGDGRASSASRQDQRAPRDKLGYAVCRHPFLGALSLIILLAGTTLTTPSGATRNLRHARSRASAIPLDLHHLAPPPLNEPLHQPFPLNSPTSSLRSSTTPNLSSSRLVLASMRRVETSSLPSTTQRSRTSQMGTRTYEARSLLPHAGSHRCRPVSVIRRLVSRFLPLARTPRLTSFLPTAPQYYAPPPTPQRQPFQPLQQQFDHSRAAGTPRPGSSAFVYRDPGGASGSGGGFVPANQLR